MFEKLFQRITTWTKTKKKSNRSPLFHALVERQPANDILSLMEDDPLSAQIIDTDSGLYPLHAACNFVRYDVIVMKLLDLFPEAAKATDPYGNYPLHYALEEIRSEDVILRLISLHPEAASYPNSVNDMYPLHIACGYLFLHSDRVIETLVTLYPLALQKMDNDSHMVCYPIHRLILWKNNNELSIPMIELFINHDPLCFEHLDGYRNRGSPLHWACFEQPEDNIINHTTWLEHVLVHYPNMIPINAPDCNGETPLHYACKFGLIHHVQSLLRHPDINVNATNRHQQTALHKVVDDEYYHRTSKETRISIIRLLLHHPFIRIDMVNDNNKTPLDIIHHKINELLSLQQNRNEINSTDESPQPSLSSFIAMKESFEDFITQRKWQAYQYWLSTTENW